jgi:hypothetical protein
MSMLVSVGHYAVVFSVAQRQDGEVHGNFKGKNLKEGNWIGTSLSPSHYSLMR